MNKCNLFINYVVLYHTLHFNFRNRLIACCGLKTLSVVNWKIQLQINGLQIIKKNCTKYVSQWITLYEKVSKPILRAIHKAVLTGIMAIHNN